jgi:hypothetical protein
MNRLELSKEVKTTIDNLVHEKGYVSPVELFIVLDEKTPSSKNFLNRNLL